MNRPYLIALTVAGVAFGMMLSGCTAMQIAAAEKCSVLTPQLNSDKATVEKKWGEPVVEKSVEDLTFSHYTTTCADGTVSATSSAVVSLVTYGLSDFSTAGLSDNCRFVLYKNGQVVGSNNQCAIDEKMDDPVLKKITIIEGKTKLSDITGVIDFARESTYPNRVVYDFGVAQEKLPTLAALKAKITHQDGKTEEVLCDNFAQQSLTIIANDNGVITKAQYEHID